MAEKKGEILTSDRQIKEILEGAKTIAVVGLSPKPERDSHDVARYMQENGYTIIPVRPAQKEILGEKAYKTLDLVPGPVDIVNVFRKSEDVLPHVDEAIAVGCKVFWMQLGIENMEAAKRLTDHGIDVIMDRCIKVDHASYFKKNILV
ncbi:CoA-binding protein [Desulfoluna limicola]|jgi:predicted CoA-binding protein|uniref:CoA-binding protein n=1 Tax=Desulfoluna limicola TaxID=2810562 RepID=A0ABM7PIB9_9BACT|nr:CoA-binding protein [Desulfoluna limicola]BCS96907.1 CoA-binding protein [Desulfoluna limicola]